METVDQTIQEIEARSKARAAERRSQRSRKAVTVLMLGAGSGMFGLALTAVGDESTPTPQQFEQVVGCGREKLKASAEQEIVPLQIDITNSLGICEVQAGITLTDTQYAAAQAALANEFIVEQNV